MKDTLLDGLHAYSAWQPDRRIDFSSFFWARSGGGVLIDPLPMSDAQRQFVAERGGARNILVTNADHWRDTSALAGALGARVLAPAADREALGDRAAAVDVFYEGRSDLPDGLGDEIDVRWVHGGKTAAEAVLYLEPLRALVFGDIVRSHVSGQLMLLPDAKLTDRAQAIRDVLALRDINQHAILLGDGDSLWTGARSAFLEFLRDLGARR
ncbi:MAG: hypothetical protein RL562_2286 [Planctomycetota bacterium]|jgi:hypothetical protein